ncbi:hypothetical protein EUGRSUZ_E03254 [Eucalyptus grandis]|uniref:Uncharacterized protein n=2 Tax=Eucalyptus grandis TaxID=71139 RepID=A0ACC3KYW1_EUCGR|nr:hypothetical protein EUGRSUZ_E03254 [Eucalyptus grandis]
MSLSKHKTDNRLSGVPVCVSTLSNLAHPTATPLILQLSLGSQITATELPATIQTKPMRILERNRQLPRIQNRTNHPGLSS